MKSPRTYSLSFLFALLCVISLAATVSSCKRDEIIPRKELAHIYADIFLLDATISNQRNLQRPADTSRVYAAVLEKYGYTEDDFMKSQEKYILDANRYARILKKSQAILENELKNLKKERDKRIDLLRLASNKKEYVTRFVPDTILLYESAHRSVCLSLDSLLAFDHYSKSDTIYAGPQVKIKILEPADSVSVPADSVMVSLPLSDKKKILDMKKEDVEF